jgi:hypothetical protein
MRRTRVTTCSRVRSLAEDICPSASRQPDDSDATGCDDLTFGCITDGAPLHDRVSNMNRQLRPCPECGFVDGMRDEGRASVRDDAGSIDGADSRQGSSASRLPTNSVRAPHAGGADASLTRAMAADGAKGARAIAAETPTRRRVLVSALLGAALVLALSALGADLRAGRIGAGRISFADVPLSHADAIVAEAAAGRADAPGLYDAVRAPVERLTRFEAGDPRLAFSFAASAERSDAASGVTPSLFANDGPVSMASTEAFTTLLRRSELRALAAAPDRDRRIAAWIVRGGARDDEGAEGRAITESRADASAAETRPASALDRPAAATAHAPLAVAIVSEARHDGSFADWGVWSGSVRVISIRYERDALFGPREPLASPAHVVLEPSAGALTLRVATGVAGSASYVAVVSWNALLSMVLAWALATALLSLVWRNTERRRIATRRAHGCCIACGHQLDTS